MVSESDIREALRKVMDPEINANVVDLGLIYGIEVEEDKVKITMTLTTPYCPLGPQIVENVKRAAESVEGVKEAEVEVTFDPPWNMEMMSPELKEKLGLGV